MAQFAAHTPSKSELRRNLKHLKAILVKRPLDLDARVRAARTLRLLGKPRDALQHYRAVARYLALAGQPLQAIAVLKELLQVDPDHHETLLFLAKLYARTRAASISNVGRVAVPIDDGQVPRTLGGQWPMTATGVWRAIRPMQTDEFVRPMSPEEVGAHDLSDWQEPVHEVQDVEIEASLPALAPLNEESFEIIGEPSAQELLLPQVGLLSSLSQAAFVDLANAMRHREARAGDTLFALGDPGDSLLLLSRGKVSAFRPGLTSNAFLEELVPGDFLGLLSAISPRGRAATVIAQTDIEFFEIPMFEIERLIKTHPAVEKTFYRFVRHRLLMSVLSQLPVVHELPSESREAIARRFKQRPFTAGEELVYEGAEVNTMFLILKGRMAIGPEATSGDIEDPITVVEPGDLVGCIAAQAGTTADTCIQALEDGVCAVITHKVFEDLATVYTPLQRMAAGLDDERYLVSNTVFTLSIGLRADRINIIDD